MPAYKVQPWPNFTDKFSQQRVRSWERAWKESEDLIPVGWSIERRIEGEKLIIGLIREDQTRIELTNCEYRRYGAPTNYLQSLLIAFADEPARFFGPEFFQTSIRDAEALGFKIQLNGCPEGVMFNVGKTSILITNDELLNHSAEQVHQSLQSRLLQANTHVDGMTLPAAPEEKPYGWTTWTLPLGTRSPYPDYPQPDFFYPFKLLTLPEEKKKPIS